MDGFSLDSVSPPIGHFQLNGDGLYHLALVFQQAGEQMADTDGHECVNT
jgi:hypothetical protein